MSILPCIFYLCLHFFWQEIVGTTNRRSLGERKKDFKGKESVETFYQKRNKVKIFWKQIVSIEDKGGIFLDSGVSSLLAKRKGELILSVSGEKSNFYHKGARKAFISTIRQTHDSRESIFYLMFLKTIYIGLGELETKL